MIDRVLYIARYLLTVRAYCLGGGAALSSQKTGYILRLAIYDSVHKCGRQDTKTRFFLLSQWHGLYATFT